MLLLLAGIALSSLMGNNGIIKNADNAREISEIATEKEKIELIKNTMKMEKYQGTEITQEKFQEYVDEYFGTNNANGSKEGDNDYIIEVVKTGNIYEITEEGNTEEIGNKADMKKDENPGVLEVDGDNYTINSIEDLVAFSYNVNTGAETYEGKTIKLGRNLFFNGLYDSYANPDAKYEAVIETDEKTNNRTTLGYKPIESTGTTTSTIKELVTTEQGFIPVGLKSGKTFKGEIDGQGYYIGGLYIQEQTYAGLLGYVEGNMSISNLGIKNANVSGNVSSSGFISTQENGNATIDNCYFIGELSNGSYSAGILAYNKNGIVKIGNSYCNSDIKSQVYSGGILAYKAGNGDVKIGNSYCNSDIKSEVYGGGILAYKAGNGDVEIENCNCSGYIEGLYSGGIVGDFEYGSNGLIKNSHNNATIFARGTSGGGIIGYSYGENITLENCYNTGDIEGRGQAGSGGLVGSSGYNRNNSNFKFV